MMRGEEDGHVIPVHECEYNDHLSAILRRSVYRVYNSLLSDPFSGNTLFVGNLAWEVDEDTLGEFFTSQGHTPSSVRIITNQDGRSRGYVG